MKLDQQKLVLRSAVELAWWARNGDGKQARRALRHHMEHMHVLCEVPDLKDTKLDDVLKTAEIVP